MVGSSFFMPSGAPGRPTLVRPVRIGDWPVMKAARPAVQLCWPYQSVNSAPSLGDAVDVGRLVAHHAVVVGADVELADVVAPDDEDVIATRYRIAGGSKATKNEKKRDRSSSSRRRRAHPEKPRPETTTL
jgi:hypothetical protein